LAPNASIKNVEIARLNNYGQKPVRWLWQLWTVTPCQP